MKLKEIKKYESEYFDKLSEEMLEQAYKLEDKEITSLRFKVEMKERLSKVLKSVLEDTNKAKKELKSMESSRDWFRTRYHNLKN